MDNWTFISERLSEIYMEAKEALLNMCHSKDLRSNLTTSTISRADSPLTWMSCQYTPNVEIFLHIMKIDF